MEQLVKAKLKKGTRLETEIAKKVHVFDDEFVFEGEIVNGNYGMIFYVRSQPLKGCGFKIDLFDLINEEHKTLGYKC